MGRQNQYFANALWMGLAAPVNLFASTPGYFHYAATYSVAMSFAQVGAHVQQALNRGYDGAGRSTTGSGQR